MPQAPTDHLSVEGRTPSLDGATGWVNSPPLTAAGLRGKVVLVNFWTYTCINWLRQLPYLCAWPRPTRTIASAKATTNDPNGSCSDC